jgi:3-hydroxyisobutyrate dehydrogenase
MVAMHDRGEGPQVALLGTGIMGSAMARRLIAANVRTMVWDRSASATSPLLEAGVQIARSPDMAVPEAAIVITMLPTAGVVNEVIFEEKVAEAHHRYGNDARRALCY